MRRIVFIPLYSLNEIIVQHAFTRLKPNQLMLLRVIREPDLEGGLSSTWKDKFTIL